MQNSRLSPQEAAAELLRRRRARTQFRHFIPYVLSYYRADRVHILLADLLERVLRGECRRLMIFAPPQHGKSLLVSTLLPAAWLSRFPNDPVILTSYGSALVEYHSRNSRAIVESPEYQALFPWLVTDQRSRARDHWNMAWPQRGKVLAVGVGGPITGHGAKLAVIDDPFENWEQAQSENERRRVWDWYRGTFRPRVLEGGAIVLIMTRWHEDDLAGRLLQGNSDSWEVLRLPALAETQQERDVCNLHMGLLSGQSDPLGREPGEAVAPRRFTAETLAEIKRDVGSQVWMAEYQGTPRALEGNRFKRDWFRIVESLPTGCRFVRYWDKAGTAGGGDFSAGVLLAEQMGTAGLGSRRWYVVHVLRGQWSSGQRNAIMRQTAALDKTRYGDAVQTVAEQEPGSGGKESAEITQQQLAGYVVAIDRVTGSKDVRMEPFAAQCEAGNVALYQGDWNGDWLDEICAIPTGKYRDQADASAGAFNKLCLSSTKLYSVGTTPY